MTSISETRDKNPSWTLRRPVASPAFDILFSLMIPEPEKYRPTWKIQEAIEAYFDPMLEILKKLCHVSIKSQILYLSNLSLKPQFNNQDNYYAVSQQDLGLAINIGTQLSSHVTSRPTLNFLTYIPVSRFSPLMIVDQKSHKLDSNAFLVPRWGGVLVLNTNSSEINMDLLMRTFVTQFKQLIGLYHFDQDLVIRLEGTAIISPIEYDFLIKFGLVENLAVAQLTMKSLSHLLTQISNIVINEEVSQQVFSAVEDYQAALELSLQGDFQGAFLRSQKSFISSEKAFFDDTLLALLYFPYDQKYAIYIPLFLPVGISFMSSFWPFLKGCIWK